jgi:integrase/recombinase XerD
MSRIAPTIEAFFTERLITQRNASPRTIAAYRDTIKLLLRFAQEQTGKQPTRLEFADLDAPLIGAFLNHLEHERGNSIRTRNARLAAIHSLYRYTALSEVSDNAAYLQ